MRKCLLLFLFISAFSCSYAQFYYNDVVSLNESNHLYQTLIKNNIKEVTATSTESDGTPTEGFAYSKKITGNGSLVSTHTELETGGTSDDFDVYDNNRLAKSSDSSDNVLTTVNYTYNNEGNILQVQTQTDDTAMDTHSVEIHQWFYTGAIPDSMIRIKDNDDSTLIHFKKDEHQNIIEETWIKKGRAIEHYYYYYNGQNRLTDIVRFNSKAQRMLPDFLFEYDDAGTLVSLTQVPQGSSDYVVWKYVYDDRGLKIKDVLFDKHQELLGTVSYSYQ